MHIQYYGLSCLKITGKPEGRGTEEVTIVVNPFTRTNNLRPPQLTTADIILSNAPGKEYTSELVTKSQAVVIDMPGEYAVKGVQIIGLPAPDSRGDDTVTIFVLEMESMRLGILAGLGKSLGTKQFDELVDIDILLLPVGGNNVLSAKDAADLARKVEPAHIIPLQYRLKNFTETKEYESLTDFCAIMGDCSEDKEIARISLKAKDSENKSSEVIVLTP